MTLCSMHCKEQPCLARDPDYWRSMLLPLLEDRTLLNMHFNVRGQCVGYVCSLYGFKRPFESILPKRIKKSVTLVVLGLEHVVR
mmetsp:Transcript_15282/g.59773  ORF Transcript_15282/g.59773 Transcript_15282/m.59773 type:complete len:84 (-) Transcript_15282:649-900(-)